MSETRSHTESASPDVRVGDIWKEADKRFERYVLVMRVDSIVVTMRKCEPNGDLPKGSRVSASLRSRFHGKRGGYAMHHRPLTDDRSSGP